MYIYSIMCRRFDISNIIFKTGEIKYAEKIHNIYRYRYL